jgi:dihydrofolate synthase/folylpolyglutamate synthase
MDYENRGLRGGTAVLADGRRFFLPMPGAHQAENLSGALCGLAALGIACPPAALAARLAANHLPGRLEYLPGDPAFLLDGAHNPQAIARLVSLLAGHAGPLVFVIAMMADKEIAANMALFAACPAELILTTTGEARSAAPEVLAVHSPRPVRCADNPRQALDLAMRDSAPDCLIVVAGSFHLVGAVRPAITERTAENGVPGLTDTTIHDRLT